MKTVLILAALVVITLGVAIPKHKWKLKDVDADFVRRQKLVLSLFDREDEDDHRSDCQKYGNGYRIEDNINNYTNKKAVEKFLKLYQTGFMPKSSEFSIFYERMRDEAIVLYDVMYYAKDFTTFLKTAAWAKLNLNEGQFFYAYYVVLARRLDTHDLLQPAPHEVYPHLFFNMDIFTKVYNKYLHSNNMSTELGVRKENDYYVLYANYSNSLTYPNEEQRLSYLTEDIGWNAFYFYFRTFLPTWWRADNFEVLKENRGEIISNFYQQMLARYSLERLSNGMDDIPKFSWHLPIKTGYYPFLSKGLLPFTQRSNYFEINSETNYEAIRVLDSYEKNFIQTLQQGYFKTFDKMVDIHDKQALNYAVNYWQTNADLYSEELTKNYKHNYEVIARHVLSASPESHDKYTYLPSALNFYQTSFRDPAFYQLYQRIFNHLILFKEYLRPNNDEDLKFVGVKINNVTVSKLITYFDFYDFNVTNRLMLTKSERKRYPQNFLVRQLRLNQKPFTVSIDLESQVDSEAIFKIFLGPKYDNNGHPYSIEKNWMKFFELDWYMDKVKVGKYKVERKSTDFKFFNEDTMPTEEIWQWLSVNKVPHDMATLPDNMPRRLMLPKGTQGGYPFQIFVIVFPYTGVGKYEDMYMNILVDKKPLSYPFHRPAKDYYFRQPNMFFKDVKIYHKETILA